MKAIKTERVAAMNALKRCITTTILHDSERMG